MRLQGADGALGKKRAEREGHRGAIPNFGAGDIDEVGQAHAAELGRRGDAVPARLRPAPVNVGEAGRRRHDAVLVTRASKVAGTVERRNLLSGEAARFRDNGRHCVPIEAAHEPLFDERRKIGDGAHRKEDVGRRRTIRHFLAAPCPECTGPIGFAAKRVPGSLGALRLLRHGQNSLCTLEFARNAHRKETWRSTAK
jgi:hypothetical protein